MTSNNIDSNVKFSALPEELQHFNKFVKDVNEIYPNITKSDFLKHLDGDAQVLFLKKSMDESKTLTEIIEELESTFQLIQKSDVDCFLDFPKQKFSSLESLISKFILINQVKDIDETFRIHIFLDSLPPILRYEVSKCSPISVQDAFIKTRLVESSSIKCFNFSLFEENYTSQYGLNQYQSPFFAHPYVSNYISHLGSSRHSSSHGIRSGNGTIATTTTTTPNGTTNNNSDTNGNSTLPPSGPSIPSRTIDWKPRQYYRPYKGQVICFYCGIFGHKEAECRKKAFHENRKRSSPHHLNNNNSTQNNSNNNNNNNNNNNSSNQINNNENNNTNTNNNNNSNSDNSNNGNNNNNHNHNHNNRRINIKSSKTSITKNNKPI